MTEQGEINSFLDLENHSAQTLNRLTSSIHGGLSVNIERPIRDIDSSSRYLSERALSKIEGIPSTKEASKYVDNKLITKNLSSISEPLVVEQDISTTDVASFLKANFERMILVTVDRIQEKTIKQFEENHEQSTLADWNKEKKRLEETLGQRFVKANQNNEMLSSMTQSAFIRGGAASYMGTGGQSTYGGQSMFKSQFNPAVSSFQSTMGFGGVSSNIYRGDSDQMSVEDRTKLSTKMRNYAEVVKDFIHVVASAKDGMTSKSARLFRLTSRLEEVHTKENPDQRVVDSWRFIKMLIGEDGNQDIAPGNRNTVLPEKSVTFLESQWFEYVKNKVPSNSNQSSPADIVASYLSGFSRLAGMQVATTTTRNNTANLPTYGIVYLLLRAGCYREAKQFLEGENVADNAVKGEVITAIDAIISKNYPVIERKKNYYNSECKAQASKDVFLSTLFQLFGGDANASNKCMESVQDFLWLKLFIMRSGSGSIATLQNDINEHIKSNSGFPAFDKFQWLCCTNQIEGAIAHLYQQHEEDAVHLAIALQVNGLIVNPIPQPSFSNNEITNNQTTILNFGALIKSYINRFFTVEIDRWEIVNYYMLFDCLKPTGEIKKTAISDLLVMLSSGRIEFIDQLSRENYFSSKDRGDIVSMTATELDSRNDYISSMDLWRMEGQNTRVVEIFNSKMSALLNSPLPDREILLDYGKNYIPSLKNIMKSRVERNIYQTSEILIELCHYFTHYNAHLYELAMSILERINILPLSESDLEVKATECRSLSPHITKNLSIILQSYIDMLIKTYQLLNNSIGGTNFLNQQRDIDQGTRETMNLIIQRANIIYQFTGKIDYHLPGNTLTSLMNFIFTTSNI